MTCPDPDPLGVVDQLAAAGIGTLMVGFAADESSFGVGRSFLNDMACAGGTAKGFPGSCTKTNGVYRVASSNGETLFLTASNTAELVTAVSSFKKTVCCGCVN